MKCYTIREAHKQYSQYSTISSILDLKENIYTRVHKTHYSLRCIQLSISWVCGGITEAMQTESYLSQGLIARFGALGAGNPCFAKPCRRISSRRGTQHRAYIDRDHSDYTDALFLHPCTGQQQKCLLFACGVPSAGRVGARARGGGAEGGRGRSRKKEAMEREGEEESN